MLLLLALALMLCGNQYAMRRSDCRITAAKAWNATPHRANASD